MSDPLLDKDTKIKDAVNYLMDKFDSHGLLIKDHWADDNMAIGLTDNSEKHLVYISTLGGPDNTYYVALENPSSDKDFPYEPAGDFDKVSLKELELLVKKHLNF